MGSSIFGNSSSAVNNNDYPPDYLSVFYMTMLFWRTIRSKEVIKAFQSVHEMSSVRCRVRFFCNDVMNRVSTKASMIFFSYCLPINDKHPFFVGILVFSVFLCRSLDIIVNFKYLNKNENILFMWKIKYIRKYSLVNEFRRKKS